MEDTIRFGKVSNIDYAAGKMEVAYEDREDSVTDMLGMLSNREYQTPKVGDIVAVIHNSNGAEEGIVLGTHWSDTNPPPEGEEKLYRKDYDEEPGKCMTRYDGQKEEFLFHTDGEVITEIKKDRTETVEQNQKSTVKGDATLEVKGKLTVKVGSCTVTIQGGTVEIKGGAKLSMSAPTISIDGSTVNITGGGGDAKIAGISLVNHTHKYTAPLHQSGLAETIKPT